MSAFLSSIILIVTYLMEYSEDSELFSLEWYKSKQFLPVQWLSDALNNTPIIHLTIKFHLNHNIL